MQLTITKSKKNFFFVGRGIKEDGWSLLRDRKPFSSLSSLYLPSSFLQEKPVFFITFRPPSGRRILHKIEGGFVTWMDGRRVEFPHQQDMANGKQ